MDLASPHEPFHKLIKMRTAVLIHHFGRTYRLACAAFGRAEEFLAKIASHKPQDEKETGWDLQYALTQDPPIEQPSGSDQPNDVLVEADGSHVVDDIKDSRIEPEPTVIGEPNKSETAKGDTSEEAKADDKISQAPLECQYEDLPTCGGCSGALSFPLWYCIFCDDNLFICDTCDAKGVPDLMRSSGKHTEEHHLIRCLVPETDDEAVFPSDQRLISMEDRLADMQTQFKDLAARIGNIEVLLHKLAGTNNNE